MEKAQAGSENFNAIHDDLSLMGKKKTVTLEWYLNKSTFRTI